MAFFKKIKKTFHQISMRKNKKSKKNQTIKGPTEQAIVVLDYEVITSGTAEDAETHRPAANGTIEGSGFPQNLPFLDSNHLELDVLTFDETESNASNSQSFDEIEQSSTNCGPFNINPILPGEIPNIEDSDYHIHDEGDASSSPQLPSTPVPSLKSESSTCDILDGNDYDFSMDQYSEADDSTPFMSSKEDDDDEFFDSIEYGHTPLNHPSAHASSSQKDTETMPRATRQSIFDTDAKVLTLTSSTSNDSLVLAKLNSKYSIESLEALHDARTDSNEFFDIGFDVEEVIFTDVNAMIRHYSKAERGKRITINPFRLECVEGIMVDAIVEGVDDDDAVELTDEVIEKEGVSE